MRRMYGDPVQEEPAPEPLPHIPGTPASTTLFVQRMVRNFGGARFKRSVQEGKPACFRRLFADMVFHQLYQFLDISLNYLIHRIH